MTATERHVELLLKILLGEWNGPCWCVESGLLGRFVERLNELLMLILGELGGAARAVIVVDDGLERLV